MTLASDMLKGEETLPTFLMRNMKFLIIAGIGIAIVVILMKKRAKK